MNEGSVHISGIRVAHVDCGERDVRVNRPAVGEGSDEPIQWAQLRRREGVRVRCGQGRSGVRYWLVDQSSWRVMIETANHKTLEIGSARMQDHAVALAVMWERAVQSGRIDV
ncbi:hypothetical protein ACNOYE_39435 [Nannocystaceae bacterium ST9]